MWCGDNNNPVPNPIQQKSNVSEVKSSENRALNVRRDLDKVKDFTVKLLDIDTAIMEHIDKTINIHVVDNGSNIKVPIFYASPEKWKSIQVDGYLRDQQGKLQLPAVVFKRNSIEKNESLSTLNRHLTYSVLQKFNNKNQYSNFSTLNNKNAPTHAVYGVTLPDHISIVYEFSCWTEAVEQMNTIIEKINFATEEYWGDPKRFKFRAYISNYSLTTENSSDSDRIVRSSFDLTIKAYLLEESFENRQNTVRKTLTPKKIVIGTEIVSADGMDVVNDNLNKNKKPYGYSFKNGMVVPDNQSFETPTVSIDPVAVDSSNFNITKIKESYDSLVQASSTPSATLNVNIWHQAPTNSTDYGEEGWMAYDGLYHYIYVNGIWKRKSIADWGSF
jgi:hypothetical protein